MSRISIASTLKAKRKDMGLSVEAVCGQLNSYGIDLSKNTLYNYESGYRQPDADTLMALCEIYDIEDILATFGYKEKLKTENSPSTTEVVPGDDVLEMFNFLNRGLVSSGLLGENDDITEQQAEILISVARILHATFNKG